MDNIFSLINQRLFFSLAAPDRMSNYELLIKIYNIFTEDESRPIIPKEELVLQVADYIKERNFSDLEDEDELISSKNSREQALLKINQFRKNGWLNEDVIEGFETSVSLEGNVIPILETLKTVARNNNQIEYTGYVNIIYLALKTFDYSKSTALLEQIEKNTRELMGDLQGLCTKIKHFITNLLQNPDNTPQQILDTLLVKYQKQVLYVVFNNLRTKDNPDRYSSEILKILNSFLENDNMSKLIQNYIETKNISIVENEDSIRAIIERKLTTIIRYVINSFEYISELINVIDSRNTKYLKSATSRLKFLLNNNHDVEGVIVSTMKKIKDIPDDDLILDEIIKMYSVSNIDNKSLFERSFNQNASVCVEFEPPEPDINAQQLLKNQLLAEDMFSKRKIKEFVLGAMGSKDRMMIDEILVKDFRTLVMVVLLQVYSENDDMPYFTQLKKGTVSIMNYRMQSFEIIKKGIKNEP